MRLGSDHPAGRGPDPAVGGHREQVVGTLPGDTSASSRYYQVDVTEPFVLEDGQLPVPTGPGIGVDPIPEVLADLTVWSTELRLGG